MQPVATKVGVLGHRYILTRTGYYRPASVRSAHSRLAASVSGTDALGSPVTTRLSLDGSSTPNGEYDAEVEDSEGVYVTDVDRGECPAFGRLVPCC